MRPKKINKAIDEAKVSICAEYVSLIFGNECYEELNPSDKFKLVNMLVRTKRLESRYQA
tara:strand:+ start:689 stop:865 length:177 start_codon:yes stop_codon:yes gene_type:complete